MNNENTNTKLPNAESTFFDELKGFLLPRLDAANVGNSVDVADLILQVFREVYAGQVIYIPKNSAEHKAALYERNRRIAELYASGITATDIAQRFDLSRAHVLDIVGRVYRASDS